MKPGFFTGLASLLLLTAAPAVAQYHNLTPLDQRLPTPPKAKPVSPQEQQQLQGGNSAPQKRSGFGHQPESFATPTQGNRGFADLSDYAPDAKAFTGQPIRANEPIDITLVSPAHKQVMSTRTVQLVLDVQNFALAPEGNRLHVILDNGSPVPYVNPRQPVTFRGLEPGGHTLRVYAVGPDGRMLKTPGSYLLRHFFVQSEDVNNYVPPEQPYLTINLPPDGPVTIPADGKVWFDFHAHNAPLGPEGPYSVHYRINGLHNELSRDQGVFWENLQPGKYDLEIELKNQEGKTVPGLLGATKRTFVLQQAAGEAPSPTTTPAPKIVFDQVPGYDPNPHAMTASTRRFAPVPSTNRDFAPIPGARPSAPVPTGGNSTPISAATTTSTSSPPAETSQPTPTPPPADQTVIRSAPAVTEEEAEKKDEGVIDLDAQ